MIGEVWSPNLGGELCSSVIYNIFWQTIVLEHMIKHELCSFKGCGYLWQWYYTEGLGKSINDDQNDCIPLQGREVSHEIQGQVGPVDWVVASAFLQAGPWDLGLCTVCTGGDELLNVH